MKDWYTIVAKANGQPAEISVFDEIGGWGVTAQSFIADLKALGAVKQIVLSINSPGGSVFDALAMYNALRASGAHITTKALGVAASAASLLMMAGDKRVMPENAFIMVHNPLAGMRGNADEHREMADVLDKIGASLIGTYVARTGRTEDEVKALLNAETWMSAADAKAQGFVDEVEPALNVSAVFDYDRLPDNVQALFKPEAKNPEQKPEVKPEPTPTPENKTEPTPVASVPLADQILALATEHGLQNYAAHWAVAAATLDAARPLIENAREITALCAVANRADDAKAFIFANTSVEKVRETLCARMAASSEEKPIDTTKPVKNGSTANDAQPEAVSSTSIWAARKAN